jgi:hypothetical protein
MQPCDINNASFFSRHHIKMAAPLIIINVPLGLPAFGILPPPAPANPPTAVDVVNAQKYNQQIQSAVVAADHARKQPEFLLGVAP